MSVYEGLTASQRAAVAHDDGPLVVLAGPGAGKTRVITRRIVRLIQDGVDPESIVAVTFTVRAAAEMRRRLADALGEKGGLAADRVAVHTFHGLGRRIIRQFGDLLGLPPEEHYTDAAERRALLWEIIKRDRLFGAWLAEGVDAICVETAELIEACSNNAVCPGRVRDHAHQEIETLASSPEGMDALALEAALATARRRALIADLALRYQEECRRRGWLSYGDLNTLPLRLLRDHADAAAIVRSQWRHAVVDEFQDVNAAQVEMVRAVFPPGERGRSAPDVCVVGDDDQAIYGFRGADPRALERFKEAYAPAEIMLRENWRSEACIIDAANATIGQCVRRFRADKTIERPKEKGKALAGACVECVQYENFRQDGEMVAAMVLADKAKNPARPWGAYAVIAQTHADLDRIHDALRLEGVPVAPRRLHRAADDDGVKDAMAWARLLAQPGDSATARRLMARPPYGMGLEDIGQWERAYTGERDAAEAAEGGAEAAPGDYVPWLVKHHGGDGRIARLGAVYSALAEQAAKLPADEMFNLITRECAAAEADLLPAAERAKRILALVAMLRFARTRQERLGAPGDLRAFFEYYDALDESGSQFEGGDGIDAEDAPEPSPEEGDAGGVTLLTAHSAKGLEFDTVFVVRVEPVHGFPRSKRERPEGLPAALRPWGALDEAQEHADEQRRLFYVACTRAQRRLVLIGKMAKGKSATTNYFKELCDAGLAVHRAAADVLLDAQRRANDELAWEQGEFKRTAARRAMVKQYMNVARAQAAAALDRASRPDLGAGELEEITEQLRLSAARLAVGASVLVRRAAPEWVGKVGDGEAGREARSLLDALARSDEAAGGFGLEAAVKRLCVPPKGPLRMSYSQIAAYQRCPMCYYIRNILGLPDPKTAERAVGNVAHDAMSRFYREWRQADAEGRPKPGLARLLAIGRERIGAWAGLGEALRAQEQATLREVLTRAYEKLHDENALITEFTEKMIEVPLVVDGVRHTLIAKPDRIDDLGGGSYRIIDYKTGQEWKTLLEPGEDDLQMGVYALAADHVFGDGGKVAVAGSGEYWLLKSGRKGILDLAKLDRDAVRAEIAETVRGILGGRFMPGKDCKTRQCLVLLGQREE